MGDTEPLPELALGADVSPEAIAAMRGWLAQLGRAAAIEGPAPPFLLATPLGLAPAPLPTPHGGNTCQDGPSTAHPL